MTAKELIDWLATLPGDLPVIMPGEDDEFCEVASAFEDIAIISGGDVELADERDGTQAIRVVRLFGPDD